MPAITHKNCETAPLSLLNAMPKLRLMHGAEKNSLKSSKNIRRPLHNKSKGSYEKDCATHTVSLFPPPSPPLPPSSNVVYDDMICIVEIDVGKLVRSYITSTTLIEGGRGWNENFFPFSPRVLLWSNHESQYIL